MLFLDAHATINLSNRLFISSAIEIETEFIELLLLIISVDFMKNTCQPAFVLVICYQVNSLLIFSEQPQHHALLQDLLASNMK